ncbi:hypothetical protein [Sporocytophaga myxococcoides]|uniref:hypothetical protein n=1 Tax=Sporocytophaga myxococcoides TaxID=153721 RepID=UPI00042239EF|nr:hypothetical protein [Sporocytophaga myxococcoides]
MIIPEQPKIASFPKNSKVWVYQSDREFSLEEQGYISEKLNTFVSGWESHGRKLAGTFEIRFNRFIIIAVDESVSDASGCSIDKSVVIIREIAAHTGANLLDRSLVAIRNASSPIHIVKFNEVSAAVKQGIITQETLIYNNTITSLQELETNWEIPAKSSWVSRFFNN